MSAQLRGHDLNYWNDLQAALYETIGWQLN